MVLLFFFSDKNAKDFIFHCGTSCPLVFQLHHTYNSVSSLHHAYCAVLSSFTMGIISVLSSSPWIVVLLWTWSFWYDSDSFSGDSSEVGWHPSPSLIFVSYHFRLGHDGACLAQILWRWVCISPLCFPFVIYNHLIAVFHDMSSSSKWCITTLSFSISFFLLFILLCSTLLMSVISIFCSFVVISFCSFSWL